MTAPGGPDTGTLDTRLGELSVRAGPDGLRRVWWGTSVPEREETGEASGAATGGPAAAASRGAGGGAGPAAAGGGVAATALRQLAEYLRGERRAFELPLAPGELPPFRRRVLAELVRIPYGATVSYGELAARCGRPGAARAVGNAVGRNPLPVVVPCHRVVRSDGSLGGYGGGRRRKRELLRLEGAADC